MKVSLAASSILLASGIKSAFALPRANSPPSVSSPSTISNQGSSTGQNIGNTGKTTSGSGKTTSTGSSSGTSLSLSNSTATSTSASATITNTFFNGTCTAQNVSVRKEWRSLTEAEKKAFIDAELCLMNLPSQTGLSGVTSRWSDLQATHRWLTNTTEGDIIHYVGQFLPWHRLLMHTHETLLKNECGYTGTLPWWDELLDANSGNFFQSNMWDDDTGFGEHIGPLLENTDYCFKRVWDNTEGVTTGNSTYVEPCLEYDTYDGFWYCTAKIPHHGSHTAVGGLMADIDASPGDPVSFMHHNYIDRFWWQWQQANSSRLYEISGNTVNETRDTEPATGWVNTTLAYELSVYDILPNVTVESVMNIQGGYLCYEYDY